MSTRLQQSVRDIIGLFRSIFDDNKALLKRIDIAYETVLLEELNLIPREFEDYIMNYINILVEAWKCFDVIKFNKRLQTFPRSAFPEFNVDTYKMFINGLGKINLSKANKARVQNMVGKFEPLFDCANYMINDTKKTFEKLTKRAEADSFDDML